MADPIVNLPGELWKPVVGWEGFYEVSNMGRVKSLRRKNRRFDIILRLASHPEGYKICRLHRDCRGHGVKVHQLVLGAFMGPCPPGNVVLHINSDPSDNRLANLRYGTTQENARDRMLATRGVYGRAGVPEDIRGSIVAATRAGARRIDIAREHNVSARTVARIVNES